MKTQSAKAKGRILCKEVVESIKLFYPELEDDDLQVTSSGSGGEDIKMSPRARKLLPISIECKNQEKLNWFAAMTQARFNSKQYLPVVIGRKNRTLPMVFIDLHSFLWLLTTFQEAKDIEKRVPYDEENLERTSRRDSGDIL